MGAQMAKGKCLLLLFITFFLAAGTVKGQFMPSQAGVNFQEWDMDDNSKLTHAEFYRGLNQKKLFEYWDRKSDGNLDRQEFFSGKEKLVEKEKQIVTNEAALMASSSSGPMMPVLLNSPQPDFYSKLRDFTFEEADLNRNGMLDRTEFITALFRLWDENDSGYIDFSELEKGRPGYWFY